MKAEAQAGVLPGILREAERRAAEARAARARLEREAARAGAAPDFVAGLAAGREVAVIAEIKRRSPSAGEIKADASAVGQARRYQAAGADALSVLTDLKFFGGTIDDLRAVAGAVSLPRLRKDFIVHPIQVLQAREAGASAILLIVRVLADEEIKALFAAATAAGLDALFEIHDEADLERALRHGARIIGVNNRDPTVFTTDLAVSERLIPRLPPDVIAVSESGIFTGADAARARVAGAHAILAGEALMKAPDPAKLIAEFRGR